MLTESSRIGLQNPDPASHSLASVYQLEDGSPGCCRSSLGQTPSGPICLSPGAGSRVLASFLPGMHHSVRGEEEEEALPGSGEAGGQVEASPWQAVLGCMGWELGPLPLFSL